jgi:hypothetical protein
MNFRASVQRLPVLGPPPADTTTFTSCEMPTAPCHSCACHDFLAAAN